MSSIQLRLKNIEQRVLVKIQNKKIQSVEHIAKSPENSATEEKQVIGGSLLSRFYRRFWSRS